MKTQDAMKSFLTSLILENKELITEKFRELDPYKTMSIVAKILPYITTKENAKKAENTDNADKASAILELESGTEDETQNEDENCSEPEIEINDDRKIDREMATNERVDAPPLPQSRRNKIKGKKKKRKKGRK